MPANEGYMSCMSWKDHNGITVWLVVFLATHQGFFHVQWDEAGEVLNDLGSATKKLWHNFQPNSGSVTDFCGSQPGRNFVSKEEFS